MAIAHDLAHARDVRLLVTGPPETVFDWDEDHCGKEHYPDSPARAYRQGDGRLALIAASPTNTFLVGPDFNNLRPACAMQSKGAEDPDPSAFDDRFWIQALAPLGDGRILGVASHEYMGSRHPGRCSVKLRRHSCWYSSIVATAAQEGQLVFEPLPLGERIIAAPPEAFDPAHGTRVGFFTASNVFVDGEFAFMLVWTFGVEHQAPGACLFRAPVTDLIHGWRAFRNDEFAAAFDNPYGTTGVSGRCDVVGEDVFLGPVRSVVRIGDHGPWIAVFAGRTRADGAKGEGYGVFYSTSQDLLDWEEPRQLWEAPIFWGQPEAGLYYQYPSLLDHDSRSRIFDMASGDDLWLYLTRFNLLDRRQGQNRDLIRLPVKLSYR